jgi:hypothetical protein
LFLLSGLPVADAGGGISNQEEGVESLHLTGLERLDIRGQADRRFKHVFDLIPNSLDILLQTHRNQNEGKERKKEEEKGKTSGPGRSPARGG